LHRSGCARRLLGTLACLKALRASLLLGLSFSAFAQTPPAEERVIYEKDAKEMVELALSRKLPNTLKRGAVPTAAVAEKIHEAVASSVFGADHMRKQRPFKAIRSGDFWVVYGTLQGGGLGGTAVSVIRAVNGEVLGVVHQQ